MGLHVFPSPLIFLFSGQPPGTVCAGNRLCERSSLGPSGPPPRPSPAAAVAPSSPRHPVAHRLCPLWGLGSSAQPRVAEFLPGWCMELCGPALDLLVASDHGQWVPNPLPPRSCVCCWLPAAEPRLCRGRDASGGWTLKGSFQRGGAPSMSLRMCPTRPLWAPPLASSVVANPEVTVPLVDMRA